MENGNLKTPGGPKVGGRRRTRKLVLVCVLQVFALLLLAESLVRLCGFDRPLAGTIAFANNTDDDPIHRTDSLLFYSLRSNVQTVWQGAEVTTNPHGLRGLEFGPKESNEFRIISLGESTTFGAGVADDETYSACLEELLQTRGDQHTYRVINAGVSGYTSFQSLKYLESRGLKLKPNLVLFYHELNDFLPARYSDRELFESRVQAWHRDLAEWSAAYRAISAYSASRMIAAQRAADPVQSDESTALPVHIAALLNSEGLPQPAGRVRVSIDERRENLRELAELCRSHGITLVFIHPAYAASIRHSCELTEFCQHGRHLLYEAYDGLHREGTGPQSSFLDECHPNRQGHRALATGLCDFLIESQAVPISK